MGDPFWWGAFVWIALNVAVFWRWKKLSEDYVRLYRAKVDPSLPTVEEAGAKIAADPSRILDSFRYWRFDAKPQADPELEALRQQVRLWGVFVWMAMFLGMLIPFAFAGLLR